MASRKPSPMTGRTPTWRSLGADPRGHEGPEYRSHRLELHGVPVRDREREHQQERGQPEADIRQDRSPQPSNAESDIGGALHGCRAGYGLAERDALVEVFLGRASPCAIARRLI